ncbi:MAG: preprotein translocase subunit YajC [Lachnospiraceae bacterium]|nr:preprotein translocase subunit YajC [Lachnospiraceae bacterium]
MNILLTNALTGSSSGTLIMIVYIVAIIAFLYFIMIRPQRKEQDRLKSMLSSLEVGDTVCTTSGFYGLVIDVSDDTVIVEFGNNKNCRIPMKKEAIAQIEKPEEPAESEKKK